MDGAEVHKKPAAGASFATTRPDLELQLSEARQSIRTLQQELEQTSQGLVVLTLELETRVDERTAELRAAQEELERTNSELLQLTLELEDRVSERTAELEARTEEMKAISQQLWQAAKLATMGELAASIAHELNNPLATITLRIESLLMQLASGDPRRNELEIIGQESERMAGLVASLLQFSRRSAQQISTVDLREEIDNTLDLIHFHLRNHRIEIVREVPPVCTAVHADRQQLRQLLLNLFTNASDAMPRGGTLTIRVAELKTTNHVTIEIADTGVGIPPELIGKVTDPFFTTKGEGKGTGLGLAICRRIVQEHHGTFEISSEGKPGKGTTVRVALPAGNGSHNPPSPEGDQSTRIRGPRCRIL
ncbi:MAG TPA: ATP-binding protein [Blastocatellia bacterium]|nr:ATP-binding protein [Blastocatellia bacterium]